MSIISLTEALAFLDIGTGYFSITAENDILNMTYNSVNEDVEIADGTYQGDDLAVALEAAIDTAFTITSTVAYNSSTYKFTITVSANTITIDVSASDGALIFGFTEDPPAALSIVSDQAATDDPTSIVQSILNSVDEWVKEYCQRDFESAIYTNELYDGNGENRLLLDNYPIVSIARLATDRDDAIKIKNTSTDATTAHVSVDSDSVDLVVSGGANEDSSSVDFTTYTTMTAVVDQINDNIGKGWEVALVDSDYGDLKSTELLECFAKYCGARANTTAGWEYLQMAGEPASDFRVYKSRGEIYYSYGFSEGVKNIVITYTAGYSSTNMPKDLKLAVSMLVKMIYDRRDQEIFGVDQYGLLSLRSVLTKEMPHEVREILSRHRKFESKISSL